MTIGLVTQASRSFRKACARFASDERGVVAVIAGFMILIIFVAAGGAVDYGRWHSARGATVSAMDTAVLAAGRVLQIPGKTDADAIGAANEYYNRNKYEHFQADNVVFTVEEGGAMIVGRSTSVVQTPFLGLVGYPTLPVNEVTKARLAQGRFAGSNVEISLMLDVTGSMGDGTKLADLKVAAKDLIDIVVWDDQSTYKSRVAVVPFADAVNVGTYFTAVTGQTAVSGTCVKERLSESVRATDTAPGPSNYFGYTGDGTEPNEGDEVCKPAANPIIPLTSDRDLLKTTIDSFTADGRTAGHLGVAWAWNMISPKWNSVWPAASQSDPYAHISVIQPGGKPKLYKYVILMTDGMFNTQYYGDSSNNQAQASCTAMKSEGLVIYAIAFDIAAGSAAEDVMKNCATSPTHFYNATDGSALQSAFRDIALQITSLRLAE